MKEKMLSTALVASVALSLASATPGQGATIDSTHSISVSYDFSAVTPPYQEIGLILGPVFLTNADPPGSGLCAPQLTCFQADLFDSMGTHIGFTIGRGVVGASPTGVIAGFAGHPFDPIGTIILSSVGGAVVEFAGGQTFVDLRTGPIFGPTIENLTVIPVVNETPLPAALPLLATGLGALGLLTWRKKHRSSTGNVI